MDYLIDTIEGRLQMALGQKDFEIEVLKQKLSEAYKQIEDMERIPSPQEEKIKE